jgi:two-component system NarL family response regulator
MFLMASGDSEMLQRWRAACDETATVVEVRSLDTLLQCLATLRPVIVIWDTRMVRGGAARTVDLLRDGRRNLRIVACTADLSEDHELALFLAGIRGLCAHDVRPEMLRQVLDAVERGELWIRRALVPKLVDSLTLGDDASATGQTGRFAILTPREIEIARLIGQGASNKTIARQLAITERTVKAHLTTIFRKTGTDDRVKLALFVSRRH